MYTPLFKKKVCLFIIHENKLFSLFISTGQTVELAPITYYNQKFQKVLSYFLGDWDIYWGVE